MMESIKQYLEFLAKYQESNCRIAPARFMLDHGRDYPFGPDSFAGERGTPKECYVNAGKLALDNPDLTYVEGYTMTIIPIEHAWVVDPSGRVLDPTLTGEDVHGYFGIPIKTAFLRKTILRTERWGVLSNWMDVGNILATDPKKMIAA